MFDFDSELDIVRTARLRSPNRVRPFLIEISPAFDWGLVLTGAR